MRDWKKDRSQDPRCFSGGVGRGKIHPMDYERISNPWPLWVWAGLGAGFALVIAVQL